MFPSNRKVKYISQHSSLVVSNEMDFKIFFYLVYYNCHGCYVKSEEYFKYLKLLRKGKNDKFAVGPI